MGRPTSVRHDCVSFERNSPDGRQTDAERVEAYLERLAILDWTNEVTSHYLQIRSELERSGKPIWNMDLLIASHAVSQRMVLVTNNLKHFSSVPGLTAEVWS
jgi:tRNA(fMet)-specific endonuclease VapC